MIIEIALIALVTTVIIQGLHINILSNKVNGLEYILSTPSEEMEKVKEDLEKIIENDNDK